MAKISREQYELNVEITYQFIKEYIKKNGYSPSMREIADNTKRSLDTIFNHVYLLKEQGKIDFAEGKARTIRLK